jgi:cell division protein FtsZ
MQADQGIQDLKDSVDTLIIVPNDRLLQISDPDTSMLDAFRMADQVLYQGVEGITGLIMTPGLINLDFADVRTVLSSAGSALMGIGHGTGDGRAEEAAKSAISSPLLEASIEGARGLLLSIAGGSELALHEVHRAAETITRAAHPEANIIFGAVIDDALGEECRVTVIAAGFDRERAAGARLPLTAFQEEPGFLGAAGIEREGEEDEEEIPVPSLLQEPGEEEDDLFQPAPAPTPAAVSIDEDDGLDIPDFLKR